MNLSNYQLQIYGKSNKKYIFNIFPLDTQFKPIGGIYIFTKRITSQTIPEHKLIYCGKTNDLSKRFDNHHKEGCIKSHGANCICVMFVTSESDRTEIEKDILANNKFICNEKLNYFELFN